MLAFLRRGNPIDKNSNGYKLYKNFAQNGGKKFYKSKNFDEQQFFDWCVSNYKNPAFHKIGLTYDGCDTIIPQQSLRTNVNEAWKRKQKRLDKVHDAGKLTETHYKNEKELLKKNRDARLQQAHNVMVQKYEPLLLAWQHQVEYNNLCQLHTKSQKQKQKIDQKDAKLKRVLHKNRDKIYNATGYRYRDGDIDNAIKQIKSCQRSEMIPISVKKALYELERVENEFLDVFPARHKNEHYLPGTIRGGFLILDGKDGGIEPGLLMVPILLPNGNINRDLAHDLIKFFNSHAQ